MFLFTINWRKFNYTNQHEPVASPLCGTGQSPRSHGGGDKRKWKLMSGQDREHCGPVDAPGHKVSFQSPLSHSLSLYISRYCGTAFCFAFLLPHALPKFVRIRVAVVVSSATSLATGSRVRKKARAGEESVMRQ